MTLNGYPAFRPRAPWWGGDLQTLRNFIVVYKLGIGRPEVTGERLYLPLRDGSGDRLAASFTPASGTRPLVVLIHGLSGCETSSYMRVSAAHFGSRGYPVLRLNLRGAGPSRATARGHYHAGRSEDLRDALLALGPELTDRGLMLIGYSLGGNLLVKFLAEHGTEFPIQAAATVSVPIDLAATVREFMRPRNAVYHRWMLDRMKRDGLSGQLSLAERRTVEAARTVYAFDDGFVARRFGFGTAERYYADCSGLRFLGAVPVPTLLIHAQDDPWIPADAYLGFDWNENPRLTPLIPRRGGHCGFHAREGDTWHNRVMAAFFDEAGGRCAPPGSPCRRRASRSGPPP
jgi:predicted alpha/beta-fold hydrolase